MNRAPHKREEGVETEAKAGVRRPQGEACGQPQEAGTKNGIPPKASVGSVAHLDFGLRILMQNFWSPHYDRINSVVLICQLVVIFH